MKNFKRHYIQYNELVFDHVDMISEDDADTNYKENRSTYTDRHGDYSPHKRRSGLVEAGEVSFTLTLELKKLPCEHRKFYVDFVIKELDRPGRLWMVRSGSLYWAWAEPDSISEVHEARDGSIEFDVDFVLPEGIWHRANKQKTFILPYNPCDFMECMGYHDIQPCSRSDCCACGRPSTENCSCCECDEITKDMALCYFDDYDAFYSCANPYRIMYNCQKAEELFPLMADDHLGTQFCNECGGAIAGVLYSDTVKDTEGVTITLHGHVKDPVIEINGNANVIKGEYDGLLRVNPDGSVYYSPDGCSWCIQSVDAWVVPEYTDYGWTIHAGNNQLIIYPGECCGTVCAYIEVDSITI